MATDENLYDEAGTEASAKPMVSSDDKTALLPKAFFPRSDLKPGDHCEIEIVRVHDEECSVKYVSEDDEEKEAKEESPEATGEGQMPMAQAGAPESMYD